MSWKAYVVFCLLLAYCLQGVSVEFLHGFVHDHLAESVHNKESENDACHQTIYHGVKKNGCTHTAHLIKNSKCSFSELCLASKHIAPESVVTQFFVTVFHFAAGPSAFSIAEKIIHLPSRAPPAS
jgi:hypothetical protein